LTSIVKLNRLVYISVFFFSDNSCRSNVYGISLFIQIVNAV